MNDELKQALQAFVLRLLNEGEQAIDFGKDQIPLVVQEYLRWYAAESGLMLLAGVILLTIAVWLGRSLSPCTDEDEMTFAQRLGDASDGAIPFVGGFVSFGLGSLLVGLGTWHLVRVLAAPRLVILDLVRSLL